MSWIGSCIAKIVSETAGRESAASGQSAVFNPPYEDVTQFVLGQVMSLPFYFRYPFVFVTLILVGVLRLRLGALEKVKSGLIADWVFFYRSFTILKLYERIETRNES